MESYDSVAVYGSFGDPLARVAQEVGGKNKTAHAKKVESHLLMQKKNENRNRALAE